MFNGLKERLKKIKSEYLIVALLIVAIVVVALVTFGRGEKTTSVYSDTDRYVLSLEEKLEKSLSKVSGAGKVSVVVTVSGGITTEIAKDEKTVEENGKKTTTSSPVLVSGKPIVLREVYPEIVGVLIVAKGGDDIRVKMALLDAAVTTLGISCDKIQILNQ